MLKSSQLCPDWLLHSERGRWRERWRERWRSPLSRLIIARPWVLALEINLLATPTFIAHEPRQNQHVTSSWRPPGFISLAGAVLVMKETGARLLIAPWKAAESFSYLTGEAETETDPRLHSEERFTVDIIRYNRALVPCVQPLAARAPRCGCFVLF